MKLKWVRNKDFKWSKANEPFDCFIIIDGEIKKATYEGIFSFKYGVCGRNVPTHIMKIKTPKLPTENE